MRKTKKDDFGARPVKVNSENKTPAKKECPRGPQSKAQYFFGGSKAPGPPPPPRRPLLPPRCGVGPHRRRRLPPCVLGSGWPGRRTGPSPSRCRFSRLPFRGRPPGWPGSVVQVPDGSGRRPRKTTHNGVQSSTLPPKVPPSWKWSWGRVPSEQGGVGTP